MKFHVFKIYIAYLFLSFILISSLNAQEEIQEDIKAPLKYNIGVKSSYTSSLSATERSFLKKNIFEILMQTNRFNIILGGQFKKTKMNNFFSLTVQITDAPALGDTRTNDLNVKLILRDEIEDFLINFKQENRVLRDKLQITLKSMLYSIFYGQNYDIAKDELIEDKIIPLKKKFKEKRVSPKVPPVVSPEVPPVTPDEPQEAKEEVIPSEQPPKIQNDTVPPKKPEEKTTLKKKEKKKDEVKISDFNSPNLDLEKDSPKPPKEIKLSSTWTNSFRMYVGSVDEEIIADSIVTIGTTTSRIVLGANGHVGVENKNHFYTYGAEIGLLKGEHEFGFGPKYDFYGGYNIAPFGTWFSVGPSVSLSNLNYAAVFTEGAGEKRFSGGGLWIGGKSEIFFDFNSWSILLDFRYQKIMAGSISNSDGASEEASGTKTIMSASVSIWKGWGIGVRNETIEMTTLADSNLVVRDDSFGIFLTYQ